MAQFLVPGALGGVQALEPVGAGLLAAEVVAQSLALAKDRAVAREGDVAQLGGRLARLGPLLLERAHRGVGSAHGAAPSQQRRDADRQRAEHEDGRVPLADVDVHARDPRRENVDGDGGDGAGRDDPTRPARRCRSARLHGAASLDLA
jgi:hypothetical protein